MINKSLFVKMMNAAEEFIKESDRWDNFGIEVYEMPIGSIPWTMFNCWIDSHFDEDGRDWINWYLWERKSFNTNEVLPCYEPDGTQFFVHTPSDLWNLVSPHVLKIDNFCSNYENCQGCINS